MKKSKTLRALSFGVAAICAAPNYALATPKSLAGVSFGQVIDDGVTLTALADGDEAQAPLAGECVFYAFWKPEDDEAAGPNQEVVKALQKIQPPTVGATLTSRLAGSAAFWSWLQAAAGNLADAYAAIADTAVPAAKAEIQRVATIFAPFYNAVHGTAAAPLDSAAKLLAADAAALAGAFQPYSQALAGGVVGIAGELVSSYRAIVPLTLHQGGLTPDTGRALASSALTASGGDIAVGDPYSKLVLPKNLQTLVPKPTGAVNSAAAHGAFAAFTAACAAGSDAIAAQAATASAALLYDCGLLFGALGAWAAQPTKPADLASFFVGGCASGKTNLPADYTWTISGKNANDVSLCVTDALVTLAGSVKVPALLAKVSQKVPSEKDQKCAIELAVSTSQGKEKQKLRVFVNFPAQKPTTALPSGVKGKVTNGSSVTAAKLKEYKTSTEEETLATTDQALTVKALGKNYVGGAMSFEAQPTLFPAPGANAAVPRAAFFSIPAKDADVVINLAALGYAVTPSKIYLRATPLIDGAAFAESLKKTAGTAAKASADVPEELEGLVDSKELSLLVDEDGNITIPAAALGKKSGDFALLSGPEPLAAFLAEAQQKVVSSQAAADLATTSAAKNDPRAPEAAASDKTATEEAAAKTAAKTEAPASSAKAEEKAADTAPAAATSLDDLLSELSAPAAKPAEASSAPPAVTPVDLAGGGAGSGGNAAQNPTAGQANVSANVVPAAGETNESSVQVANADGTKEAGSEATTTDKETKKTDGQPEGIGAGGALKTYGLFLALLSLMGAWIGRKNSKK
ncbi:MAG: hypothetical protein LBJ38_03525 [Oscillospiraceae bacterium]|jgi:hypothetical protein|nr:hypothetical protein [Oscillospiraceae bacterium]